MTKIVIIKIISFLCLILLQVTILNNISLWGYATPLLYIYFILKLPASLPSGWLMTFAFLMGLIIDMFCDTPGMNALACVTMAATRKLWFGLSINKYEEDKFVYSPSFYNMGLGNFIRYISFMVSTFCIVLFLIEAFTFVNILGTLLKIIASGILTIILIMAIDSIMAKRK